MRMHDFAARIEHIDRLDVIEGGSVVRSVGGKIEVRAR